MYGSYLCNMIILSSYIQTAALLSPVKSRKNTILNAPSDSFKQLYKIIHDPVITFYNKAL